MESNLSVISNQYDHADNFCPQDVVLRELDYLPESDLSSNLRQFLPVTVIHNPDIFRPHPVVQIRCDRFYSFLYSLLNNFSIKSRDCLFQKNLWPFFRESLHCWYTIPGLDRSFHISFPMWWYLYFWMVTPLLPPHLPVKVESCTFPILFRSWPSRINSISE